MGEYLLKELDFRGSSFLEQSFNEFYEEYYKKIYNFIYFKTGDAFVAEDLTCVVVEKALTNIRKYDEAKSSLNSWVFTIARNSIIDHYRLKSNTESHFEEGEETLIPDRVTPCAEDRLIEAEQAEAIAGLLQLLAEQEREIVILKFWGGLKNIEIAEQTGIKQNNVNVIVFRALKKLKSLINEKNISL
jgi:RNA polymerase sigma-70 factor (ECF subfamily)